MKNRTSLFIGHADDDTPVACNIVHWLEAYGFDNIQYHYQSSEQDNSREGSCFALAAAQVFIVLLSPEALESERVNSEINAALTLDRAGRRLKIIPIMVKVCRIPLQLHRYRCLDITSGKDPVTELEQLVKMIESQEQPEILPATPEPITSEPVAPEPPKQQGSKFSINYNGNVQAHNHTTQQAETISITIDNGTRSASRSGARQKRREK